MASKLEDRVRAIIADQLGAPISEVVPEATFVDLGSDSLDSIEIIMALEEEWDLEIEDEEAEKMLTVQSAIDYIESKVQ